MKCTCVSDVLHQADNYWYVTITLTYFHTKQMEVQALKDKQKQNKTNKL